MKKVKVFTRRITVALGGFILLFAITEFILRLLGFGNLEVYDYDANTYWKLRPSQHCFTKINRERVTINRLGFRGEEMATLKHGDELRILSVGDSRTFGWGVADTGTYSSFIKKELSKHTTRKIEVINNGVNAYSYPQIYSSVKKILDSTEVDGIIVGCANWWTEFLPSAPVGFKEQWKKRIVLKNLCRRLALYHAVIEGKLKNYYVKWRRNFIPHIPQEKAKSSSGEQDLSDIAESSYLPVAEEYVEKIIQLAESKGVPCYLVYIPYEDDRDNEVDLKIKGKMAFKYPGRAVLVNADMMRQYHRHYNEKVYLDKDPVHPNALGHKILGECVAQAILKSGFLESRGRNVRN